MINNRVIEDMEREYFQRCVIEYYRSNGRVYPWRLAKDPYVILASELLLQKTTAKQVLEIHEEFFTKYPNVESLANASPEELELIIGKLGLRKRAKFLVELANQIKREYSEQIPDNSHGLLSLKGVGEYTANAVLIFAYDKVMPIVDTNVARVIRRFFSLESEKPAYADRELWKLATELVPKCKCREYSYGLLDLAALACHPKSPLCNGCPLMKFCGYASSNSS